MNNFCSELNKSEKQSFVKMACYIVFGSESESIRVGYSDVTMTQNRTTTMCEGVTIQSWKFEDKEDDYRVILRLLKDEGLISHIESGLYQVISSGKSYKKTVEKIRRVIQNYQDFELSQKPKSSLSNLFSNFSL